MGAALGEVISAIQDYDGTPESAKTLQTAFSGLKDLGGLEIAENLGTSISGVLDALSTTLPEDSASKIQSALNIVKQAFEGYKENGDVT